MSGVAISPASPIIGDNKKKMSQLFDSISWIEGFTRFQIRNQIQSVIWPRITAGNRDAPA